MLNDLFKRPRHLVQQSVQRMSKQMLKPFKRAFTGDVLEEEVFFIYSQFLKEIFFFAVPRQYRFHRNADKLSQTEELLDTQRFNPLTRHYNTVHVLLLLH